MSIYNSFIVFVVIFILIFFWLINPIKKREWKRKKMNNKTNFQFMYLSKKFMKKRKKNNYYYNELLMSSVNTLWVELWQTKMKIKNRFQFICIPFHSMKIHSFLTMFENILTVRASITMVKSHIFCLCACMLAHSHNLSKNKIFEFMHFFRWKAFCRKMKALIEIGKQWGKRL